MIHSHKGRIHLQNEHRVRDVAMFNLAIDRKPPVATDAWRLRPVCQASCRIPALCIPYPKALRFSCSDTAAAGAASACGLWFG